MLARYFDYNATTPLGGDARRAMEPYLEGQYGNPMTSHRFGEAPRAAIAAAREDVLDCLGTDAATSRVVLNGGATEGLNHALKGIALRAWRGGRPGPRRRIVLGAIEHVGVKRPAQWLAERFGFETVVVPVDSTGVIDVDRFLEALDPDRTAVAALHWANNEVGTIQPVGELGSACRERGIPFLCDAVQVVGKLDLGSTMEFCDAVALSAHKFYGPKGTGALVLRREVELDPLLHGATQEDGLRAGTHAVANIVGQGVAARRATEQRPHEAPRVERLRNLLWSRIEDQVDEVHWNGRGAPLLVGTLNMSFLGCPSSELCDELDRRGFAISAGAACRSGDPRPSENLMAMGLGEARALSSVRVSLGHGTSEDQVRELADALADVVRLLRARN